jgi:hypothetical protein
MTYKAPFPHCDSRVLHAPGECVFCDDFPKKQALRMYGRVNFTGHHDANKRPCPAEQVRDLDHIERWVGNRKLAPNPDGCKRGRTMMRHIMVDLETLSTKGNAAIISIGAIAFDPETGELGAELKVNVDGVSSQKAGGHVDAGTVAWWFAQSNEARAHLLEPKPVSLKDALELFRFYLSVAVEADFYIWGNGATFDNTVLRSAFESVGLPIPWSFRRDMCYRTMRATFPEVPDVPRVGVFHDSLDDAKTQARHLCAIFAHIKKAP